MTADPLRLPLLDLLRDEDPDAAEELQPTPNQLYRTVISALERDLVDILNTRERCESWPSTLKELGRSVLAYGLPDITGAHLASKADREAFLQSLAPLIRRTDTRFRSVRIVPADTRESGDRTLRFRIEATVRLGSGSEALAFDFKLEPVTRTFLS